MVLSLKVTQSEVPSIAFLFQGFACEFILTQGTGQSIIPWLDACLRIGTYLGSYQDDNHASAFRGYSGSVTTRECSVWILEATCMGGIRIANRDESPELTGAPSG